MRVRGLNGQRIWQRIWKTLGVASLAFGIAATSGCARRLELAPSEFERIEKREQAVEDLRVYVSRRLVVNYELEDDASTYEVDREIRTSREQQLLKVIIGKRTKGLVIDTDERNGAPLLWVTFSARCQDKDCAYGFVQTEDGVFRLTDVPEREGYKQPKAHYICPARPMEVGKLKSLAEKNDVYVWKNRRGKVATIDLIVKKRSDRRRQTDIIRDEGIR